MFLQDLIAHYVLNFNGLIITVSFFIFIFSKKIISFLDTTDIEKKHINKEDEEHIKKKINFLHLINLIIFATYFLTLGIEIDFLHNIIKALFIILAIYISNSWIIKKILIYYGDEIDISGETYFRKGYKANFFSFLINILSFIIGLVLCIQILEFDTFLQTGGVIAGILAFTGFTASVWAPDMIAGIIILHNDRIQIGNVVKIKELGVTAWVKRISLSEIKLVDLTYSHPILFRPSKFRELTIENLSAGIIGKKTTITRVINIKVGYKKSLEDVKKVCLEAYENMNNLETEKSRKYFPENFKLNVEINNFGDNATAYKLFYEVNSPFYILKAERLLNKYLQISQHNNNLLFSTPTLINIEK